VSNFDFNKKVSLQKPQSSFTNKELEQFGERPRSSPENILIDAVDPDGTRFEGESYACYRCVKRDMCYRKLTNPQDPMRYMIIHEVRYPSISSFEL